VGVTKRFGPTTVVDSLALDIAPGEFVTLLGPSGSGKSTVLSCIAGFATPDEGDVFIGNDNVTLVPPYKRDVGMVFQNYALFPHLTVADNLAFPLKMRSFSKTNIKTRVEWALNLVKLDAFGGRYPRQLSGGQQQRVALARVLIFEPPVLLLDEPLSALDKKLRTEMQEEIVSLHDRLGMTVVFVTHDQEEALTMSDRVVVLNQGRIEQIGTPSELYQRPVNRFVSEFIGESNYLTGNVVERDGRRYFEAASGITFLLTGNRATPGPASATIRPEHVQVLSCGEAAEVPAVRGTVRAISYVGEFSRLTIETATGAVITAKHQNSGQSRTFHSGDEVAVRWSDELVVIH
jgi:spermidine/putrescine ABC transporter ATP-binding subunit